MDVLHHLTLPLENPVLIFAVVLFIILFAPIILNRFRVPPIIGLIIAGAAIGPYGFNLLLRDSSIVLFGTVGLLYIMFLAGLEIDMADFLKNKYNSLFYGIYTFLVPMGTGIGIGLYILDYTLYTSIFIGIIFASHTLIAYPIASRFGISRNKSVSISVGGTVITDTLALLVLAGVSGALKGETDSSFILFILISFLIVASIIIWLFPILARWFFKKEEDPISQYIFILGLVFLAAFMSELAGLEPIIGAFLSGLALNRLVPHTSALMNKIEFVGNALFIPFFLIGVGMLIDFSVFFKGINALILAGLLSAGAIISKFIPAYIAGLQFRLSKDEWQMMFGLSTARAAATLAAVLIGYKIILQTDAQGGVTRVIQDDMLNATIIMILITCTISSFIVTRSARQIAITDSADEGPEQGNEIDNRVLIPVAYPDHISDLIQFSVLTNPKKLKSAYYALNVRTDEQNKKAGDKLLESAVKAGATLNSNIIPVSRYDVNINQGILYTIKEHEITDVILGMHAKTGITDSYYGTVLESLIQKTSNTIFILKCHQPINTLKKFVIIVPERAEYEIGFIKWIIKIHNVSVQLNSEIIFYTEKGTDLKIASVLTQLNHNLPVTYQLLEEWSDYLIIARDLEPDDLCIIVSARKNTMSYNPLFEKIPKQLSKYFADQNTIILFPEQHTESELEHRRMDGSIDDLIEDNLKRIDSLGKYVKKMIKGN